MSENRLKSDADFDNEIQEQIKALDLCDDFKGISCSEPEDSFGDHKCWCMEKVEEAKQTKISNE